MAYSRIPAIDEDNQMPPVVRQALAESEEMIASIEQHGGRGVILFVNNLSEIPPGTPLHTLVVRRTA